MTEIEAYQPQQQVALTDPTGGRLVAWAEAAGAAHQLALSLSQTSFVPAVFKGNPGDATAAILMGDELGLSPIAALRSIYVVHGTPALYAKSMVALAQSHGHDVWTEKSTPGEVVVCGRRKGTEHVERAVWTIARATKAGYTSNKKYASNPEEMLYSKGAGEIVRKVAADVLVGIPFSVEDIELDQQPTSTVTRGGADAQRVKVQRAKAPEAAEPEFDTVEHVDVEPDTSEPPVGTTDLSKKTRGRMFALLGELNLTDDEQRDRMGVVLGRTVESRASLTEDEAQRICRALEARKEREKLAAAIVPDPEPALDDPTLDEGWQQ